MRRKPACELIGSGEFTVDFFAHSSEEWIYLDEKILRRQAAERSVPHPFVPHGADAALHLLRIRDAAKRCGDHVAMFKRRDEFSALRGIVAKPVEEFRESPFRGIHAPTPVDRGELLTMRGRGDFGGFRFGTMIAPQIIVVEGLKIFADGNDGRAGRIER